MIVILTLQWLIIAFQIGMLVSTIHLTRKGVEDSYFHDLQVAQGSCCVIGWILRIIGFFL